MAATAPGIPAQQPESFANDFLGMTSFLIDPAGSAKRVFHKWFWVGPVIVVSIISLVVGILMMPIMQHALESMPVPPNANPEQFQKGIAMSLMVQHVAVYFTPIIVAAVMAIEALVIWGTSAVLAVNATFRAVFNLVAGCSLINALASIATIVILKAKGEVSSTAELRPPLGLDIFLGDDANKVLAAFLGYFSVFELWWIVMMILIFSIAFRTSKAKAVVAMAPIVILSLGLRLVGAVFQR